MLQNIQAARGGVAKMPREDREYIEDDDDDDDNDASMMTRKRERERDRLIPPCRRRE